MSKRVYFIFLFLLLLVTACNGNIEKPSQNLFYIESTRQASFSAEEFIFRVLQEYGYKEAQLPEYEIIFKMIRNMKVKINASSITYKTKDPFGNSVVASGVVYYPEGQYSRGVVEISPFTRGKKTSPSEIIMIAEAAPAISQYAIIIPDLIGSGSTDYLPQNPLFHDNIALVSADMRKAAEEYFRTEHGISLPRNSILFSYSLGASGSLALARFYQEHKEYNVKVDLVYIGGGVYDINIAFDELARKGISNCCVIPDVIRAADYYYDMNLDYTQIYARELLEKREEYCSGEYSAFELTDILGTDLHAYMHPDFFTEKKNQELMRIRKAFEGQTLIGGWMPEMKIEMFHSINDNSVPVACSDSLYDAIKASGNVMYEKEDTQGHVDYGLEFFKRFIVGLIL